MNRRMNCVSRSKRWEATTSCTRWTNAPKKHSVESSDGTRKRLAVRATILWTPWAIYTPSNSPFEVTVLCESVEGARHLEDHNQVIQVLFRITQYNADVHNVHTHSPLWTHVCKPYPLWAPPKDWAPVNLEILEHWCLVVDGNVAYHLMHNTRKSLNKSRKRCER
jgi:hypothetical protein